MKKTLLFAIILSAVLFGCGKDCNESSTNTNNSSETSNQQETEASDVEEVHIDESDMEYFENLDEFKRSDFYANLVSSGITPYLLQYDEERYELQMIYAEHEFYTFMFNDNVSDHYVRYTIDCDTYMKDVSEFGVNAIAVDSIITTAERNGKKYDVYVRSSTLTDERNYSLSYLPFDRYGASISIGNAQTPDEILEYFDDFELVPDNG